MRIFIMFFTPEVFWWLSVQSDVFGSWKLWSKIEKFITSRKWICVKSKVMISSNSCIIWPRKEIIDVIICCPSKALMIIIITSNRQFFQPASLISPGVKTASEPTVMIGCLLLVIIFEQISKIVNGFFFSHILHSDYFL